MDYEAVMELEPGVVVDFSQYYLDRHELKQLDFEIKGKLLLLISPEERLSKDLLATYYPESPEKDYPVLSYSPFIRLVIEIGTNRMGVPIYRTVEVNKYYLLVGLQTIETFELVPKQPELSSQLLGFNSYDVGKKFK